MNIDDKVELHNNISGKNISIEIFSSTIKIDNTKIKSHNREIQFLKYLIQHKEQIVSREEIRENIWDGANNKYINLIIHHLRQKLIPHSIIIYTETNGYKLSVNPPEEHYMPLEKAILANIKENGRIEKSLLNEKLETTRGTMQVYISRLKKKDLDGKILIHKNEYEWVPKAI